MEEVRIDTCALETVKRMQGPMYLSGLWTLRYPGPATAGADPFMWKRVLLADLSSLMHNLSKSSSNAVGGRTILP